MTDNAPDKPFESELDELLAIRERLSLILETLSEEELAAYMKEAREFLDLVVPQDGSEPEPTPPAG